MLLINTIIYDSSRPTFSIAISTMVPMVIIVFDLLITAVKVLMKKKEDKQ